MNRKIVKNDMIKKLTPIFEKLQDGERIPVSIVTRGKNRERVIARIRVQRHDKGAFIEISKPGISYFGGDNTIEKLVEAWDNFKIKMLK